MPGTRRGRPKEFPLSQVQATTCKKLKREPKESQNLRLAVFVAECTGESRCQRIQTADDCKNMTRVELNGHLRDLGLQVQINVVLDTEELERNVADRRRMSYRSYIDAQSTSWAELREKKAAVGF